MTSFEGSGLVGPADTGKRLDVYISERAGLSRSRAQRIIEDGLVTVDGTPSRKNHPVRSGENIRWRIPPPEPEEITPQEIPVTVVYEDSHIAVIDKPAGMVMYPGPGHADGTLINALMARYPGIEGVGGRGRPGVFHRLDLGTSGLVAVALTEASYLAMVEKVRSRELERSYTALVTGDLSVSRGTIDASMGRSRANRKRMAVVMSGGREAVTRFTVTERFAGRYCLVSVMLDTGRTHQIRVHFSYIGHPVAGDPEYSRGRGRRELGLERQFLHASKLRFDHPVTGESVELESPLPEDLQAALDILRKSEGGPHFPHP